MHVVNRQIRVKDFAIAHDVINLEQLCKRQGSQGMVERIEARGANMFPAHLNTVIKLNDCDVNHEIKFVEANETQQLIRAHASFTLDENSKEDVIKEFGDLYDVTQSLDGSNRGPDPGQKFKGFEEHKIEEEEYSEYGAVIDSTIEATNIAAMHDPTSKQEQEIEWLEPDAIEFAQRHAKLEGKSEYEASRDDGISYYSGGAEDRFYPGGVRKLIICIPMHRKHTGLSQYYAVMEECITMFGG